jgi:hypothetical protein
MFGLANVDAIEPKCSRAEKVQVAIAIVLGVLFVWLTVT